MQYLMNFKWDREFVARRAHYLVRLQCEFFMACAKIGENALYSFPTLRIYLFSLEMIYTRCQI